MTDLDRPTDRLRDRPWRRQPGETAKAWHAFGLYLAFGPARTAEKVRIALGKKPGYQRMLERWSSRWKWVERANAFDVWETEFRLERRVQDREISRQMYVDAMPGLIDLQLRFIRGQVDLTRDQSRMLRDALDRAGVTAPKRVEITGAEGGSIAFSGNEVNAALDDMTDAELFALVEMTGAVDGPLN